LNRDAVIGEQKLVRHLGSIGSKWRAM